MPSQLLYLPGTKLTFKGSGGDVALTFASTADQALAVSAQHDRGTGAKPGLYRYRIKTQVNAAVVVGRSVRIYLIQTADATDVPGNVGVVDAEIASAADVVRNMDVMGVVSAHVVTSGVDFIKTGRFFVDHQFISIGIFNNFGVALHATESVHYIEIWPVVLEAQ